MRVVLNVKITHPLAPDATQTTTYTTNFAMKYALMRTTSKTM